MKKLRNAKPATPTQKTPDKKPTPQQQGRADRGQRTTEAPVVNDVHCPKPDEVKQARTRLATETRKLAHENLVADLVAGRKQLTADTVSDLTQKDVATIAKSRGWTGYSGLTTQEARQYLLNAGKKPAPQAGTTREAREVLKTAKEQGLISGPISALKADDAKKLAARVEAGESVGKVEKAAANVGTADWHKALMRTAGQKGFTAAATAKAKELFGAKASISTLKVAQLRDLTKALGLSKGETTGR